MRSGYAWTMRQWQRSEWRLGFNSVMYEECREKNFKKEEIEREWKREAHSGVARIFNGGGGGGKARKGGRR